MYPTFDMANLSKYRREFLEGAQASDWWKIKMVRNGSLDGLCSAQEYLRSTNISMSLSDAEKLHNGMEFKAKRKNKTNFVSAANKKLRLAWARKHRQLTVSDWHVPGTNRPHQVRPQVQDSGDGVMLWGCISGDRPGYSTAIIDGTIDSNQYVEILKTSLMQALEYYGK
ncbi:hypothetical protein INT46_007835 [Mucor plumbeus]|uniref:Transposase Tc1-like domain-containing protein n=1 Tax=Mucor plumbeus TaxID=97098 RepID=A0A8H7QX63_9FUNG|nr:hypothetical protein INT46_007835 [Mucor plumbeus]